ncbi:MAG: PilZ domain-containing protein, partial [Desulfobulbaceae bacterium]|nr:PilZ domain-containing protein [Desulfobulbaceae bacterium]
MQFAVQVAQDGKSIFLGRTLNVSSGGLLVEGRVRLKMAEQLELKALSHKGESLPPLLGRVVRIDEDTMSNLYRFGIALFPTEEDWTRQTVLCQSRNTDPITPVTQDASNIPP